MGLCGCRVEFYKHFGSFLAYCRIYFSVEEARKRRGKGERKRRGRGERKEFESKAFTGFKFAKVNS